MSAEPTPAPQNKATGIVERFRDEYGMAIAEASISAEHTATEGWQKLYTDHEKNLRTYNRDTAKDLRNVADRVELSGSNEDIEKEIGEIKKTAAAHREQWDIYQRSTVAPVKKCVDECERVITEFKQRAEADENLAPLHNVGLVEVMRMEIAKHPRASWDAESGRVIVNEFPPTMAVSE